MNRFRILTTGIVLLGLVGTLTGCQLSGVSTTQDDSLPRPVTENGMTLSWGKDIKTQALAMIQGSNQTCNLDIYELSDPDVLKALADARQRGVNVRVVVDATEKHSQNDGVPSLQHAGVPVASQHVRRGISHIKMLIADGTHAGVLIGGMNYGANSWNNNDASVYLTQPNGSFAALFGWDWQRANHRAAAEPQPQPPLLNEREVEQHAESAIQQATSTVDMEAFNLSDRGVMDALKAACRRGLKVEILLDPDQAQNRKSAETLRSLGATVRFYHTQHGEWMHAKILDVDGGRVFIIGSANFSHQAYTYNHEGDIELHQVPKFHASLMDNLSAQIARGTDYPERSSSGGGNE